MLEISDLFNMERKTYNFEQELDLGENIFTNKLGIWKIFLTVTEIICDHQHHQHSRYGGIKKIYNGFISLHDDESTLGAKRKFNDMRIALEIGPSNYDTSYSTVATCIKTNVFYFSINKVTFAISNVKFFVQYEEQVLPKYTGSQLHLKNLFETANDSDFTIIAGGRELKVHRIVLKRSDMFDKMLSNEETSEAQSGIARVVESYEVIYELCRFLYYDHFDENLAVDLIMAANKYQVNDLFEKLEKYLENNITKENFFDVFIHADLVKSNILKKSVIDFVIKNRKEIFKTELWKELKTNHVQLAMLVYEKFMLEHP
ncbi:hypothetical protein PVAND_005330 [Polypedilum vanderplanki]|uniref:BTB domain-containing protein n=1 Tax=Polypedilum vanderplanki TaxID=319348 RepID=A0A9J6C0I7_POLVA|nr:hypothetical protein PVAND_005330 [Polypedilum vanderplanki]